MRILNITHSTLPLPLPPLFFPIHADHRGLRLSTPHEVSSDMLTFHTLPSRLHTRHAPPVLHSGARLLCRLVVDPILRYPFAVPSTRPPFDPH